MFSALKDRATDYPDEIAISGEGGSLRAAELLAAVEQLSGQLRGSGVSRVALCAENSLNWAIVDLACQHENLCLVPVPTFFSAEQMSHLLSEAAIELLIFERRLADILPQEWLPGAQDIMGLTGFAFALKIPDLQPAIPDGTKKITFTSGSTGTPKGVCLSSSACLAVAQSLATTINISRPRHLCVLPLSTLLENIAGLYMPLIAGGTVLCPAPADIGMNGSSGLDSSRFLSALHDYQPDTLILVPQLLKVLDMAVQKGWRAPQSLRFIAVGGARVAPELVLRARAKGLPVYEGYGLSECASVVSLNVPDSDSPGSSGQVLPHVKVSVVEGELRVAGNTFLGYLNHPESWGQAEVATGDLGTLENGFVTVAGRDRNVLITSYGRNISPEWIEAEILASNVFSQAVVMGEGREHLVALLVSIDRGVPDEDLQRAIDTVNERLPDYARIGTWFRLQESLSTDNGLLTENGRPRREHIAAVYAEDIEHLYDTKREAIAL
ncbi:MAG: AMP-binding protein [Halioglobus sp.]